MTSPGVLDREAVLRSLRRRPDIEAPNLYAVDATDRLLLNTAGDVEFHRAGPIAVIGDHYGALTLGAAVMFPDADLRTYQDPITGVRALAANARELGLSDSYHPCSFDEAFDGARLVLVQLPRAKAELVEIATTAAARMHPDGVLLAGGRVKHMAMVMTEVLRDSFDDVAAGLARQKSRVLTAHSPRPGTEPAGPRTARVDALDLDVVAFGSVFAGAALDHGTAALLRHVEAMVDGATDVSGGSDAGGAEGTGRAEGVGGADRVGGAEGTGSAEGVGRADRVGRVVDLGCGTGLLAIALARRGLPVTATDRSDAAIRSAAATAQRAGVALDLLHDDAAQSVPDRSVDLVICNPPFHEQAAVHSGGALKMFEASGRILRPGGELWTVHNTHLGYLRALRSMVGPTEVVERVGRFRVTRSVRAAG